MLPVRSFITVPGDGAAFNCFSPVPGLQSVEWLINGTQLDNLALQDVQDEFSSRLRVGNLAFTNIPIAYNATSIRCRGTFSSGEIVVSSGATLLLLQGITDSLSFVPLPI